MLVKEGRMRKKMIKMKRVRTRMRRKMIKTKRMRRRTEQKRRSK